MISLVFLLFAFLLSGVEDAFGFVAELRFLAKAELVLLFIWGLFLGVYPFTLMETHFPFTTATGLLAAFVIWATTLVICILTSSQQSGGVTTVESSHLVFFYSPTPSHPPIPHSQAVPLWSSYSLAPPQPLPNINHLHDLLASKIGFECFKDFLQLEFSVENILFWKEVSICCSLFLEGFLFALSDFVLTMHR